MRFLLVLIAAAAPTVGPAPSGAASAPPAADTVAGSGSAAPATPATVRDDVLRQMEIGRHWHASRTLREALAPLEGAAPSEILLLARAEAGWENWSAVVDLLSGAPWLGREEEGLGWMYLARAQEGEGRVDDAVHAYGRFLSSSSTRAGRSDEGDVRVARIRRARLLAGMGATGVAVDELQRISDDAPWAAGWTGLELAAAAAERGRVEGVRRALSAARLPPDSDRARRLQADALLVAGDTAAGLDVLVALARDARDGGTRSRAWGRVGRIRLAAGDSAAALRAFRNGSASSPVALEVARGLLDLGLPGLDDARTAFRVLERGGGPEEALTAMDRYRDLEPAWADSTPSDVRLRRARLLERAGRPSEAVEILRELAEGADAESAAGALDLWSDIRRSQGRRGDARALQNRLVDRFPGHPAAVDVVFFRADDRHDGGDLVGAARGYRRLAEVAPAVERAGLARMRLGQIHLRQGSASEAAPVFEDYLEALPRGPYWDEAAYWAAHSRMALGDEERARAHVDRIREGNPLSYYAFLGYRLLGESYEPEMPPGREPPRVGWIETEVERARLLRRAGLDEGVRSIIDEAIRRAGADDPALHRLSLELSEAGFSLEGIRLGWELFDRRKEWSRWLLRAIYPFPYRELVRREAEEWSLDPYFVAALIRQESAFVAGIRSGAGAVGLTQVVPATGRSLARSVGPAPFHDRALTHPEVNLHLGGAYLAGLRRRFDEHLPLLLSAYNAGPTRARRWRSRFDEVEDPLRFTERIPFGETREYVKRVRRNEEVYRWLYASAGSAEQVGSEDGDDFLDRGRSRP